MSSERAAPTAIQPIFLATANPGKVSEIINLLSGCIVAGSLLDHPGISALPETGETLGENAAMKAAAAAVLFPGYAVVSDDTGLEVDALGGAPGVISARYAGEGATPADNCAKLLREMTGVPESGRTARFRCVVCYLSGGTATLFEGICPGSIVLSPRGVNGFGYDCLFVPAGSLLTFGQMDSAEKNRLSHRAAAFDSLRNHLASFAKISKHAE